jgi:hypothetical protein
MQVLSVASEIFPLIKTGGLADVTGALPMALGRQGVAMRTLVPGYPVVLMAAAFAATSRGEASLAQEYGDAALDAEQAVTVPGHYAVDLSAQRLSLSAVVAMLAGAWADAAAAWLEGVERNRRGERMTVVAMDLTAAASALCYSERFADAVPVATEALALARTLGLDHTITGGLVSLAQALSRQAPEQARVLLDEADDREVRRESYGELTRMALAASMISDWPLTARFARRSIPHLHWMNHRPYLQGTFTVSARALADSDPEAAATIQGAAHTLTVNPAPTTPEAAAPPGAPRQGETANRGGLIVETRRDTTRLLVEALGDERLRALRDHGAAMDTDAAVAYTLARLDAFLTTARAS